MKKFTISLFVVGALWTQQTLADVPVTEVTPNIQLRSHLEVYPTLKAEGTRLSSEFDTPLTSKSKSIRRFTGGKLGLHLFAELSIKGGRNDVKVYCKSKERYGKDAAINGFPAKLDVRYNEDTQKIECDLEYNKD